MLYMAQGLFCGEVIILQINLKMFCEERKVRLEEVKEILASTGLLSSNLCQGSLGDASFCCEKKFRFL